MAGFWSMFHLYYLYSLERVGVLYGIRLGLGDHDWYLEGALLLCRSQREDGTWVSYDEIPVVDTSVRALLFLKRATCASRRAIRSKPQQKPESDLFGIPGSRARLLSPPAERLKARCSARDYHRR
jgi:hypothetical protein